MRSQKNKLLRRPRICDTPIFNVSFQFCRRGYCHLGETSSCLSSAVCQNVCVRMFKSRLLTQALSSFWEEREKKRGGNRPGVGAPAPTPGNCPTNLLSLSSLNDEKAGVRSQNYRIRLMFFSSGGTNRCAATFSITRTQPDRRCTASQMASRQPSRFSRH